MTLVFSGDAFITIKCSQCDYEKVIEFRPGETLGVFIDKIMLTLLGDCPNKATHNSRK